MKKYIPLISFIIIGVFSPQLADIFCQFWLDDLHCYFQSVCTFWDSVEFYVAHKFLSLILYYIGWYGFAGSVIVLIEDYLGVGISKVFNSVPINFLIHLFLSAMFINLISSYLMLDQLFEVLYKTFN